MGDEEWERFLAGEVSEPDQGEDHEPSGCAHLSPQLIGRYAWFREPPGISGIVRIVGSRRYTEASGSEFVATRMECAATIVGRNRLMFDIGEFFELSTPASGFHNPVWSLHLFEATTLEAAMLERDLEYGPDFHFEWKTQP